MYKDLNHPEGGVYSSVRFSNGTEFLEFLELSELGMNSQVKKRSYFYEIIPIGEQKLKVTSGGETYTEIDADFIVAYRKAFLHFLNSPD